MEPTATKCHQNQQLQLIQKGHWVVSQEDNTNGQSYERKYFERSKALAKKKKSLKCYASGYVRNSLKHLLEKKLAIDFMLRESHCDPKCNCTLLSPLTSVEFSSAYDCIVRGGGSK